jgi:hypothetical protein
LGVVRRTGRGRERERSRKIEGRSESANIGVARCVVNMGHR